VHDICLKNRRTGKIFYKKLGLIFIEMLSFVKSPAELKSDLDKWLYGLKHLTEFPERPDYLSGSEFDPLFDLAEYANLNEEERNMYNQSLKRKWDNENVMDYAVETAVKTAVEEAEQKAEKEKRQMAAVLKNKNVAVDIIVEATGLSINEIQAL
jgi:hypothetical protein